MQVPDGDWPITPELFTLGPFSYVTYYRLDPEFVLVDKRELHRLCMEAEHRSRLLNVCKDVAEVLVGGVGDIRVLSQAYNRLMEIVHERL